MNLVSARHVDVADVEMHGSNPWNTVDGSGAYVDLAHGHHLVSACFLLRPSPSVHSRQNLSTTQINRAHVVPQQNARVSLQKTGTRQEKYGGINRHRKRGAIVKVPLSDGCINDKFRVAE